MRVAHSHRGSGVAKRLFVDAGAACSRRREFVQVIHDHSRPIAFHEESLLSVRLVGKPLHVAQSRFQSSSRRGEEVLSRAKMYSGWNVYSG